MLNEKPEFLLAVDAGVKTGLALFDSSGKLHWHRSHNMGSVPALRKAAFHLVNAIPDLKYIVVEGGGQIAGIWKKMAERYGIKFIMTDALHWRRDLLYSREQRSGETAKQIAAEMAIRFLKENGTPPAQTPLHDSAEAILTGVWYCHQLGWLKQKPNLH